MTKRLAPPGLTASSDRRPPAVARTRAPYPLLIHPIPQKPAPLLAATIHLLVVAAAALRKAPPGLSADAVRLLQEHRWDAAELNERLSQAVAENTGSLITGADLCEH